MVSLRRARSSPTTTAAPPWPRARCCSRRCRRRSASRPPAVVAVAAARQVAPRIDLLGELERAAGAWQAEWATISHALGYAGGAAAATLETLDGLEVDAERMRANMQPVVAAHPAASDVFV